MKRVLNMAAKDSRVDIYSQKTTSYFSSVRREIWPLLPTTIGRVFEVGCGSGATLLALRKEFGASWIGGIEIDERASKIAADALDYHLKGDVESTVLNIPSASLDLVLLLDVLEHLVDPWYVVDYLVKNYLKVGGVIIASIPNISHHSSLLPLVINDKWVYTDSGILDRGHLRFFTQGSAVELFRDAGLSVNMVLPFAPIARGSKSWFARNVSFGLLDRFLVTQYLIRGVRIE